MTVTLAILSVMKTLSMRTLKFHDLKVNTLQQNLWITENNLPDSTCSQLITHVRNQHINDLVYTIIWFSRGYVALILTERRWETSDSPP